MNQQQAISVLDLTDEGPPRFACRRCGFLVGRYEFHAHAFFAHQESVWGEALRDLFLLVGEAD